MKLLWGTSQCNSHRALTPQQVALHEALVGHFAEQLSQSTNTSQQVALHEALTTLHKSTAQHISITQEKGLEREMVITGHLARLFVCSAAFMALSIKYMQLLWGTLQCNFHRSIDMLLGGGGDQHALGRVSTCLGGGGVGINMPWEGGINMSWGGGGGGGRGV